MVLVEFCSCTSKHRNSDKPGRSTSYVAFVAVCMLTHSVKCRLCHLCLAKESKSHNENTVRSTSRYYSSRILSRDCPAKARNSRCSLPSRGNPFNGCDIRRNIHAPLGMKRVLSSVKPGEVMSILCNTPGHGKRTSDSVVSVSSVRFTWRTSETVGSAPRIQRHLSFYRRLRSWFVFFPGTDKHIPDTWDE